VYLKDIWPTQHQVAETIASSVQPSQFAKQYENVGQSNPKWNEIPVRGGELFEFDAASTYIQEPPFFADLSPEPKPIKPIAGAKVLVMVGDSVTTDHISPAGNIKKDSPAGQVPDRQRRGREGLQQLRGPPGQRPGDDPRHVREHPAAEPARPRHRGRRDPLPAGRQGRAGVRRVESIYDASMKYQASGTPLVVLAGKDYGMGSSRDWAAKGTMLLGVKAVIAESFERIHRSNLVGMACCRCSTPRARRPPRSA
jgi:aconitate hydratase